MTGSKNKNAGNQSDNVVSLSPRGHVQTKPVSISSPEEFLQQATSLVSFENQFRESVTESAKPAARISGLDQLSGDRTAVKLPSTTTEEHSDVTPFPHDRGKPPSSRKE